MLPQIRHILRGLFDLYCFVVRGKSFLRQPVRDLLVAFFKVTDEASDLLDLLLPGKPGSEESKTKCAPHRR